MPCGRLLRSTRIVGLPSARRLPGVSRPRWARRARWAPASRSARRSSSACAEVIAATNGGGG
eukprot:14981769-Alexandrium_andersonii.AAC.1